MTEEQKHNKRLKAKEYYWNHKEAVLSRQKAQKKLRRDTEPYRSLYTNHKSLAKQKGYIGEVDDEECRSVYRRAFEEGKRVYLRVPPAQGGKFQLDNMEIR